MKKAVLLLCALFSFARVGNSSHTPTVPARTVNANKAAAYLQVYDELNLSSSGLRKEIFDYALRGWQKMASAKPVISIVDLSQPSNKKRLYVIDLVNRKLLFQTYVSHGRNSGDLVASRFSNVTSSFQSSLGFYKTLKTYYGKHGLSLQLKGLEKGFNDKAYDRNIVLHGADYVCEDFIRRTGRLGRSQGCPAVPYALSKSIIQAVKDGSCLFVYSPNAEYLKRSTYLSNA
ncbi:hypothetical protein DYU11_06890 [Fibrisoma montanum]|uniref:Murein L,D-transpeptidase catalytic domain family protein n=1 Tax=Fibrisoma montanum TaxID=2305895 RepID=A0A418ME10_9BACT|nr:murein L,D-transpeptidase catalytic domain family protein [Fibrisoma montanum]RIV25038.1 hypothetical protein DYU11_06890 [Fibrisoma montanum]